MRKAFEVALAMTWAIEPSWLATIMAIANGEGPGPEAVSTQLGRPLDNTRTVTMRDGVAVIPVSGPMFRYANMFAAISGATSVQVLARDFAAALANPDVTAIVLEVDSPGGEVTGIHELAQQILGARGSKPIVAYVGGACCSAAYWLAAAADEMVVDATAQVGSIGVYRAMRGEDPSAKSITIVSSQSPRKNPDPATKSGRADHQAYVDAVADVFVDDVAQCRGVTREQVLNGFGKGGVFVGAAAVKAGLADSVGSLEAVIARFAAEAPPASEAPGCADPECECACHADPLQDCADPECECACHEGMGARVSSGKPHLHAAHKSQPIAVSKPRPPAMPRAVSSRTVGTTTAPSTSRPKETPMPVLALVTLAALVGLSASASEEEVTTAIASQRKTRDELLKVTGKESDAEALGVVAALKSNSEQLVVVRAENDQLKAAARQREIATILEAGQTSGKLPPARVEWAKSVAGDDPAKLRALVDGLEPAVATRPVETPAAGKPGAETNVSALTKEELTTCSLLKLDPKEFAAAKASLTSAQA